MTTEATTVPQYDAAYLEAITERVFRETMHFKDQGGKVVAVYCAFTPKELIAAAGAVPYIAAGGCKDRRTSRSVQDTLTDLLRTLKTNLSDALELNGNPAGEEPPAF